MMGASGSEGPSETVEIAQVRPENDGKSKKYVPPKNMN